MIKYKSEFLLILILIPILSYVGWQAYKTWLVSPEKDIAELEKIIPEKSEETPKSAETPKEIKKPGPIIQKEKVILPELEIKLTKEKPSELNPVINRLADPLRPVKDEARGTATTDLKQSASNGVKGTLDYEGYSERDPLKPALPVKEKGEKPLEEINAGKTQKEPVETPKEIVLPTFTIQGIVWGKAPSRAIIDHQVHKIGDIIKGATILDINEAGIHLIYEGKEFWVSQ